MVEFYLNQSFLRTQEKKDSQLWRVNPSSITEKGRYFGSVIYEEYGTDELCLNFVTAEVKDIVKKTGDENENEEEQVTLDYPQ